MDAVIADAARLDSTIRVPSGMPVLWETLQLTKNIMDVVAQVCSYYFLSMYCFSDSNADAPHLECILDRFVGGVQGE